MSAPDASDGPSLESIHSQLIGVWHLVSFAARADDDRSAVHPLGPDAIGTIVYTADGHMSVQIMKAGRPPYQNAGPGEGTESESAEAARGYLAYSGRFHLTRDPAAAPIVVHEPNVSLLPNWVGGSEGRYITLSGNRLELSTVRPVLLENRYRMATLVWARADDPQSKRRK